MEVADSRNCSQIFLGYCHDIIMMDSVIGGSGIEDPHACGCLTDSDCAGLTGIEVYDYI